jgi:hypothetical protein
MAQVGLTTSRAENYDMPNPRTTIQRSRDLAAVLRATRDRRPARPRRRADPLAIALDLEGGVDAIHQLPAAADTLDRVAGHLGGRHEPCQIVGGRSDTLIVRGALVRLVATGLVLSQFRH